MRGQLKEKDAKLLDAEVQVTSLTQALDGSKSRLVDTETRLEVQVGALTKTLEQSKADTTEAENVNRATAAELAEAVAMASKTATALTQLDDKVRSHRACWAASRSESHERPRCPLHGATAVNIELTPECIGRGCSHRPTSSRRRWQARSPNTRSYQSRPRPSRRKLCRQVH